MTLKEFIVKQGWAIGFAEVRRAVSAKCVHINDKLAKSADEEVYYGDTIWYGIHKVAMVEESWANEM